MPTPVARGVATQAREAARMIRRLDALRTDLRTRAAAAWRSPNAPLLVDHLFARPYFTVADVRRWLDIAAPTAHELVNRLEEAKLIREVTGRGRNRIYLAAEIIAALQEPPLLHR